MRWNPELYEKNHSYVIQGGADLVSLLEPEACEKVLDVGCGAGQLTATIAAAGALVHGIDNSPEMIARAKERYPGLNFEVADVTTFDPPREYDAVFSNAALHWVTDPHAAVRTIAKALRFAGRFVAEFGGKENCEIVLAGAGITSPWYFPSIAEYGAVLEAHRLELMYATLVRKPVRLENGEAGLRGWFRMFGPDWKLPDDLEERLRPSLWHDDAWWIDHRRLRIMAAKR